MRTKPGTQEYIIHIQEKLHGLTSNFNVLKGWKMANSGADQMDQAEICGCLSSPHHRRLVERELGSDKYYAEITLLSCPLCGRRWLRYFYEIEAFTSSGRWYLGCLISEQTEQLTEENARSIMEQLVYFFGGSYYQGKAGKTSGKIFLFP